MSHFSSWWLDTSPAVGCSLLRTRRRGNRHILRRRHPRRAEHALILVTVRRRCQRINLIDQLARCALPAVALDGIDGGVLAPLQNSSFLMQIFLFLIHNFSFLMLNSLFLKHNS